MTDDKPKSEPGGWELMRAFERVEKRLDGFARDFVSAIVHNLLAERVKELEVRQQEAETVAEAAVDKAKTEAATALAAMRTELDNAKKQRAQTWTAIGLLAAGGAIGLFYDIFTRGLGMGG